MSQQTINNNDTGLVIRTALNAMFTELYGAIPVPIKLPGEMGNFSQLIPANTFLAVISISATNGTPVIRIGTTPNGTDVLTDTTINGFNQVQQDAYYVTDTTLYFTLSGGIVNIRLDVLQNFY